MEWQQSFCNKKILEFYDLKKLVGFDNFSGFPNPVGFNKIKGKKGIYAGDPNIIKFIINFLNSKISK